jgi:hypothetical protein
MWDSDYLYFGLHANDDALVRDSGDSYWRDDMIVIWVDGDGDGEQRPPHYDHQYAFATDGLARDWNQPVDLLVSMRHVAGGWDVEVAVPASHFPPDSLATSSRMRFTFAYCDDDDGGTWDHWMEWEGQGDNNATAQYYGALLLSGAPSPATPTATPTLSVVPRTVEALNAETIPVLDGDLGDWPDIPETALTSDTARWGDYRGGSAPTWQDAALALQAMWDADNVYFGIHVSDDTLVRDSGDSPWLDDMITIWVDRDDDGQQSGWPHDHQYFILTDGLVRDWNQPTDVQVGMQVVEGGWDVEVAVPASEFEENALFQGSRIHFTFGYTDDDDGGTWDSHMEWEGYGQNNVTALHRCTGAPFFRRGGYAEAIPH